MKSTTVTITIAIFILIISTSCGKGEKEIERDYIESIQKKGIINDSIKWMVILPGLGCHGCIQEGEVFMRDNINNREIFYVLTRIESLKILQHKIGLDLRAHENVYIEGQGDQILPTNNRVYPCIVYIEKGEVVSHEFQSPGNNAFNKLRNSIMLDK